VDRKAKFDSKKKKKKKTNEAERLNQKILCATLVLLLPTKCVIGGGGGGGGGGGTGGGVGRGGEAESLLMVGDQAVGREKWRAKRWITSKRLSDVEKKTDACLMGLLKNKLRPMGKVGHGGKKNYRKILDGGK